MIPYTQNFTEVHLFAAGLGPANRVAAVYNTAWLSMQDYQRAVFIIRTGVMTATSTIDAAVQQATDATGTGAKALTPAKAITQLTQAGGDGDDLVVVEVRTEELDVDGLFDHIRLQVTIANAASYTCVVPLRFVAGYEPVSTAVFTEIVL